MSHTPLPKPLKTSVSGNEPERLAALHRYKILDTPPEAAFDRITRLAAQMFNVPMALIALVDETRTWFKSCTGMDVREVSGDAALYDFATLTDDLLIVPDTRLDDRFASNPLVQGESGLRFYAGAPLLSADGFNLGTFCLLDRQPRNPFSVEQQSALVDLAAMVVHELEGRLIAQQIALGERAEAALRESEAKYRTLFESIDEGFCLIEIVDNDAGEAIDYRLLEVNRVFERQTGLVNVVGKLSSEIAPNSEPYWLEGYDRAARTGEPFRIENYHTATDRWYLAYASRIGGAGSRQVGIVFDDITNRKRREANLAFLAEIQDDLARLATADTIMQTIGAKIGSYLNLSVCAFIDIDEAQDQAIVSHNWHRADVSSLVGTYCISNFVNKEFYIASRAGETIIVNDTNTDARTDAENFAAFDIQAFIHVPLMHNGQWKFLFDVYDSQPRDWRKDEIDLVRELANRIFPRLERARAEALLQASHDTFRHLVDHSPFGIYTVDADFRIAQVSVAAQKTFANVRPLIGRDLGEALRILWPEPFVSEAIAYFRHTLETGEPYHAPSTVERRLDLDEVESYDWKLERITLPDGHFGVVCHFYDLSERQQFEAALRESEERFRNMADNAPVMIWVTDATGYCTYLSQSWYDFTGQTEETGLGFGWLNCTHPDDREECERIFLAANERQEAFRLEYRLQHRDGEYIWAIDAASPWFGVDGQFKGYIGSVLDISNRKRVEDERKQAEAALRQSEEQYRTLFESIDEGFCVIEVLFDENEVAIDYRFIEVNPAFEKQSGLTEAVGKTILEIAPTHESYWFEIYGNVVKTGESTRFENYASALNRWFDVYAFRIGQPKHHKVAALFQDISERKQIEQERENLLTREQTAREEAQAANRIKDEFLAVLSHELRSPLNPILGWTRLLQTGNLDANRQREALATIERNAKLQTQLIEDLLDISRIMQGKLSLTVAPVSLTYVITAAVETVRLAAEAKSIAIALDLAPAIAPVSGDAARLQQVVWNLLTNAVKFTPNGGRVTIELRQLDQLAQIRVMDTGQGIAPQFLPHVFEYFRQADATTTRKFGGLGLGLAIVRQIVEMHGGAVQAKSLGDGQGATFTVQLPIMRQVTSAISETPSAPVENQSELLRNLQILMVDDDVDTREFQAFVLEQQGANVIAVSSGAEALQVLERVTPDVLVSDIGMAEMDGYMLMQQIRDRSSHSRKKLIGIAVTAYARDFDQQKAFQSGFQAYMTKPVEPDTLVEAIAQLLDSQ